MGSQPENTDVSTTRTDLPDMGGPELLVKKVYMITMIYAALFIGSAILVTATW